jgi:hypothetical protein
MPAEHLLSAHLMKSCEGVVTEGQMNVKSTITHFKNAVYIPEGCRGLTFPLFLFRSLIICNQKRAMSDYVIIKKCMRLLTVDFGAALPINAVFHLHLSFLLISHGSVQRPQLTLNLR